MTQKKIPTLDILVEESGEEIDDKNSEPFESDEIQDKPTRIRNSRKSAEPIHTTRPEPINIGNSEPAKRPRGRPPKYGGKSSTDTSAQKFWVNITAVGLNLSTLFLAANIFRSKKYVMTRDEATAAATALMTVAFKYKSFRDIAVVVNSDNDWAVIAKGFMPYASRVFLQDIVNELSVRLFVFQSGNGKQQQQSTNAGTGKSTNGTSGQPTNGRSTGNDAIQFSPEISGFNDWRDV